MHTHGEQVAPRSLQEALNHIHNGHRLYVATCLKVTLIDRKVLRKYENAGVPLLREEGDGYRLGKGKSSVYLLPGQLKYAD